MRHAPCEKLVAIERRGLRILFSSCQESPKLRIILLLLWLTESRKFALTNPSKRCIIEPTPRVGHHASVIMLRGAILALRFLFWSFALRHAHCSMRGCVLLTPDDSRLVVKRVRADEIFEKQKKVKEVSNVLRFSLING